jgi:type I restriction-modification system DNA methylase subunit
MATQKQLEMLRALVDQFLERRDEYQRSGSAYNETQLRNDFLNPFLELLGWDVANRRNRLPQHLREVVHEDTVEIETEDGLLQKKPDYALRAGTERKYFIEAKKPSVNIETHQQSAFQIRRYGWSAGMPISVITNFDRLIIYDCHPRPHEHDNPRVARISVYRCEDYVDVFDEIYEQLSRESIFTGSFDARFPVDKELAGTEPFDQFFLEQIQKWRFWLSESLTRENPALTQDEVNYLVQMLLNRIIFLRVCEDRELETYRTLQQVQTYEELKELFTKADKRYNSGLFDFLDDTLSPKVTIEDDVLIDIFRELYYPESPYAFSVVEPSVLGDIYELFIAQEVRIEAGTARVVDKPEVVASGGVITTPKHIVDNILQRTLARVLAGKTPADLEHFSIADIACGAGTFLIAAYEVLLQFYLEWYLRDGASNHKDKVYEGAQNQWFLTLQEKQRILLDHIFGVDIDHQAVEVARFSLLLKVIEDESSATVEAHLKHHKIQALPHLQGNILWGNSLVDDTFFVHDPTASASRELLRKINPFDWEKAFPDVMSRGGFDVIVGNPPYIRIQNMVEYSPEEVGYYQSKEAPYESARSDNFDKYALFIERALSLLNSTGLLGYIVPHKFFTLRSGKTLRKVLASHKHIVEITHFGVEQVFGKRRLTYTCILILSKEGQRQFAVEHVSDISTWRYGHSGVTRDYEAKNIGEDPWIFVSPEAEALFARLEFDNPTSLDEVAEIMVGVQTSRDRVYIIYPTREVRGVVEFTSPSGHVWSIERAILRPCVYDATIDAFTKVEPNAYIIFPYQIIDNRAVLYAEQEMRTLFPQCWDYLLSCKDSLSKRKSVQGYTDDTWYRYGRSQSLTKFDSGEKLIWSTLTLVPRYGYDDQSTVFTGGGNGPYYGLRMRPGASQSIFYIQAILSHPVIEAMVTARASGFQGGYMSHGKQFMQDLPIRHIDFTNSEDVAIHDAIVDLAQQLITSTEAIKSVTTPQNRDLLARQIQFLQDKIEQMIEQVYNIESDELQNIPELQDQV